jgi:radical SAM superfamily enzyme YgiQ (UPF0313 family)
LQLSCEATLNIAKCPDILELMHEAYFCTVFCGIETPELDALEAMGKSHNQVMPILEAVATLNSYGIEVVSGIILGLDTDTSATAAHLAEFIDRSQIPVLTINLLQALPKTALWDRLASAGRLSDDPGRDSNVIFMRPYKEVLDSWHRSIRHAFAPEAIYRRFAWNARHTYPNRLSPPLSRARVNLANLRRGAVILGKLMWRIGVRGDYRRIFWQMALRALRTANIEQLIQVALVAHHMIVFARDCARGRQGAAFYADRAKGPRAMETSSAI